MRLTWWIGVATAISAACVGEQTDAELRDEVASTVAAHYGADLECVGRALEEVPSAHLELLGRNFGALDGLRSDDVGDAGQAFMDAARACGVVLTESELRSAVVEALATRYVADQRCVRDAMASVSGEQLEALAKALHVIEYDYDLEELTFTTDMFDAMDGAQAC